MGEIINFLTAVRDRIGYEAFIFVGFSFITLTFSEQLSDKVPPQIQMILRGRECKVKCVKTGKYTER
jgi:hypothetical protein